jgi:hypothetical protein
MFSSGMFESMVTIIFIMGLLVGVLVIGVPGYFIGMYYGKSVVYKEAIDRGVLEVRYNSVSGEKEYIWMLKK